MNYVLFCPPGQKNEYQQAVKSTSNNVLGVETVIAEKALSEIKNKYNPHGIVIVDSTPLKDDYDIKTAINFLRTNYKYLRIIYIFPPGSDETYKSELIEYLNEQGVYDYISRKITAEEFAEVFASPMSKQQAEDFNSRVIKKVRKKKRRRLSLPFNSKLLYIIGGAVVLIVLAVIILLFSSSGNGNGAGDTEATEPTAEEITEPVTEAPTEKETELFLEEPTEAMHSTEADTPTEAVEPKENPSQEPEEEQPQQSYNNSDGSREYTPEPEPIHNNNSSALSSETPPSSTSSSKQDASSQTNQTSTSSSSESSSAVSQIEDDGRITLSVNKTKINVGEQLTVKVSGLAASRGCDWNIDNSEILKFVSGNTTQVIVKAVGSGMTVVTAKAKSNGATATLIITVE